MSRSSPRAGSRHALRWIPLLCGAALLAAVVLVVVRKADAREFVDLLHHAAPVWLAVAGVLQLGTYVLQAEAWWVFLRRPGVRPMRGALIGLSVVKLFVDQVVPSASISGTAVMAKALAHRGIESPTVTAAVVVETVAYYLGYSACLLAAIAVMVANGAVRAPILIASGLVFLATLALVLGMNRLAHGRPPRLPKRIERTRLFRPLARYLADADSRQLQDRGKLAAATWWQTGIHLLDAMTVWALLRAVGVATPPWSVFSSFMLASLARTVGIVPGGLGTFEAVSVATLRATGVSLSAALAATLLFRGFSFWLPMIPGWWLTRDVMGRTRRQKT
jgi:uncharacterized protein (TIRG00374 family)